MRNNGITNFGTKAVHNIQDSCWQPGFDADFRK